MTRKVWHLKLKFYFLTMTFVVVFLLKICFLTFPQHLRTVKLKNFCGDFCDFSSRHFLD